MVLSPLGLQSAGFRENLYTATPLADATAVSRELTSVKGGE